MSSRVVFSTFFGKFMGLFNLFNLKILKTEAKELLSSTFFFIKICKKKNQSTKSVKGFSFTKPMSMPVRAKRTQNKIINLHEVRVKSFLPLNTFQADSFQMQLHTF